MKPQKTYNYIHGAHHVKATCETVSIPPRRTLRPFHCPGQTSPFAWGRPSGPGKASIPPDSAGSTPAAPSIPAGQSPGGKNAPASAAKKGGAAVRRTTANGCEDDAESISLAAVASAGCRQTITEHPASRLAGQLTIKALRGLAERVRGFSTSETKTTYEIDPSGERRIKSETVTHKRVAPDLSAIIFTLTNLNGEQWKSKPSDNPAADLPAEEESIDYSSLSDEELQLIANLPRRP